jgi:hypothetical protein
MRGEPLCTVIISARISSARRPKSAGDAEPRGASLGAGDAAGDGAGGGGPSSGQINGPIRANVS